MDDSLNLIVKKLNGKVIPGKPLKKVIFDDISSFFVDIYNADVEIDAPAIDHLFNQYVFNFKERPLKNLKVQFIEFEKNGQLIPGLKITGNMKLGIEDLKTWIDFKMISELKLDQEKNAFILKADSIESLGNPYTKTVMGILGVQMDMLLKIPPGKGVQTKGNRMFIYPFIIFPPPAMQGRISHSRINLKNKSLEIKISRKEKLHFPTIQSKNFIQLKNGIVSYQRLVMNDADIIMLDKDLSDPFEFHMLNYIHPLKKGMSKIQSNGSISVYLPDYSDAVK
jgi:hypothetical protein